ncbi:UNKNOWN [Stylonychia lemnae]|uniref:Uncharacterized protein n=1 Tax=Stylonychia lemnae TaxID=5949 RepID=A0A077ZT74_STYLE|nr:UNKNOWN [Stylonychia lemnae]|eukprot:CDW73083.1 UNKNOWN [Stylonychia lemnae]
MRPSQDLANTREQRHMIQEMIEKRKRNNRDVNKSFESPSQLENKSIKSSQSKLIDDTASPSKREALGEYTNYVQTKKDLLNQCEQMMSSQKPQKLRFEDQNNLQKQSQLKYSGLSQMSNGDAVSFNFSQSPNTNYQSPNFLSSQLTQGPAHHQVIQSSLNPNQYAFQQAINESQENFNSHQQNPNYSRVQTNIQPHQLANQSLNLFQPFANQDYHKKLEKLENQYHSPLKQNDRGSSNNRRANQKIEDRLLDLGKQRDIYMQKLKDFYQQKENQEILEKPMINPKSQEIAKYTQDVDLYEREMAFLQNRDQERQKIAARLMEEESQHIQVSPRINKKSQGLKRNVQDLQFWSQKSKQNIQVVRDQKEKEELDELRKLRSASKQSKFNHIYLQGSQRSQSIEGTSSPQKVEERLINSGNKTKQKIDGWRKDKEKSIKKQMNSPQINKRSQDIKYSQVPFHERLYSPKRQSEMISQMEGDFISQSPRDISRAYSAQKSQYNRNNNKISSLNEDINLVPFDSRGFVERDEYLKQQEQELQQQQHHRLMLRSIAGARNSHQQDLIKEADDESKYSSIVHKYTPLRQSRSPNRVAIIASKSRSNSKSKSIRRQRFVKKIDYNHNYKKTFHKNVLLKEWQYLPLYERQLLWSRQKDKKTLSLKYDMDQHDLREATFKPQLYERQNLNSSQKIRSSSRKADSYAEIHKNKRKHSQLLSPGKTRQQLISPQRNQNQLNPSQSYNHSANNSIHGQVLKNFNNTQSSPQHTRNLNPQVYSSYNMSSPKRNLADDFNNNHSQPPAIINQNYKVQNLKHMNQNNYQSNQPAQQSYPKVQGMVTHPLRMKQNSSNHLYDGPPSITTAATSEKVVENALMLGDDYYKKMYQMASGNSNSNITIGHSSLSYI